MARVDMLQVIYKSAVSQISLSPKNWMNYLEFAAGIYKYSFDNSLLIYAQNPTATMLAPLPLWNQIGRYVKKGEKSIAVCDFQLGSPVLNHLFDITQTTGKSAPALWNLEQIDQVELAGRLTSYDTMDLSNAIFDLTKASVGSAWDELLQDFEHDVENHFLGTLPLHGLEQHMADLIMDSVRYLIHRRCQLPEPNGIEFATITHLDTLPLVARLGYQVNDIARSLLNDIARFIKIMENERSTFYEQEGTSEPNLSRDRRSAISRPANLGQSGSEPAAARQVWADGDEPSTQPSPTALPNSSNARRSDGENTPSRTGSTGTVGAVERATASTPADAGDRGYPSADAPSESDQIDSRRTGAERNRAETEITAPSPPAIHKHPPSPEPPASGSFFMPEIDDGAEKHTAEEMLEYLLRSDQGKSVIKPRIYQFVTEQHPVKPAALVSLLKVVYGIGGAWGSFANDLKGYMTNSKGMELEWKEADGTHREGLTWNRVAAMILQLIQEGRYDEQFAPFPLEEPEWTLFDFAEQQSHEEKQELDIHSMESVEILPKLSEEDTATVPIPPSEAKEDAFEEGTFNSEPSSIADPIHAVNYRFNPEASPYVSGPKSKYKRNVEAIRLLKHLEADQRQATPEEQQILAGYVGWGGLANAFHSTASGWEGEYTELKQLLDNEEYDAARNSTITAFYTEQSVIQPIYTTLQRFGLTDGIGRKLLEPSMGTGNFFSVLPPEWNQAELHGVELDQLTGRISRQLYPQATVHLQGFETVDWRNTRFDAVFSNIPFNNIRIFDQHYQSNHLIHDYFFIKALDLLKPGGVLAFIVSKGTMDKQDSSVREILAQKADLIGAVRLPNTTFQVLAGTTVTTDIVFLQKREQPLSLNKEDMPEWVFIGTTSDGIPINRYYLSNPDHLLGRMIWDRGMHGVEQTACVPDENQQLYDVLEQALERLQAVIPSLPPSESESKPSVLIDTDEPKRLEAPAGTKNFTYIIEQGQIYYCEMGELFPQNIKGKKAERIKGLCEIRTALLEVISLQSREYGYEETELTAAQHTLNSAYDRFVDSCGYINDRANTAAFADDDQLPLLRSIEDLNPEKTWSKAAIFFRPTIRSNHLPDHAESAIEALQICLNQRLRIDLPYMAHLCRTTTAEIREELGERIFLNPQNYTGDEEEGWELDEDYLSGNVKDKLAYAILKAKELPDLFQRNVSALTTVQPAPLLPGEIDFRIGSPWIPVQYYREFMYEIFGTAKVLQTTQTVDLDYLEFTNLWRVSGKSLERDSIKVNQTYGTRRASAYEIYESSLNLQSITIRDPFTFVDSSGNEQIKYVVNAKETMIARAKQQQMKEAFASWLFRDKDRTDNLLAIYNDKFNNIRPRHYNGDHLVFAGMNEEMHLRKHQKDVVARILYSGTALMAHEVGAGKTAAMITAGMMLKRIGAIQKPMYCVPNHLTEQWANEFLRFFPAANILVTTKKDFALANRQRFVSRIAMGNYDAVIIGHSQFEKIPISSERQEQLLQDEIRNVSQTIDQVKKEKGDNWSIKQMVVFENNLKSRLERLANEGKKDDLLTFEQLGVDMLFVDEAHAYKNCFTFTKMRNVAGIGKTSSQRATDMLLKCQYLQEMNSGRGVVFATGTPISNSISEMYVMQRFLQTHLLQKLGLNFFDNWAATFGEVVSSLEITPEGSGYRMKSRFAKFHNLPELLNLFRLVADIQTADMLQLPTPKLEGDKATVIISECSPFQQQLMDEFVVRAEQIRNNDVDASEDNMLKLTHEAKLMSIDPRLVHEDAPVDPDSKLNRCIHNLYYIWQQTETEKLTQVVFCDSGTPKPGVFNVYDEVKSQLILRGVPEDDIAFIHDAKTDAQREELFERVRRGEVRILLGSTSKLGTGTNIQDRLIAAHHTDCPWRPSDIIQRDGRILRQGNRNPVVQIFRYVTKGTFDSYLWQIQEQKLRYISQVMTGKSISRSCEDTDETVLSAAEVKAVATGNPMLAEKMQVDNDVSRLKLLKANWQNEQVMLEQRIHKQYPLMLEVCKDKMEKLQADIQVAEQNRQLDFLIQLDGINYEERMQAGEVLLLLAKLTERDQPSKVIGQYRGFLLSLFRSIYDNVHIRVQGAETHSAELGGAALGNISRLENLIEKLPSMLQATIQNQEETLEQLAAAQKELGRPFEEEQKLQQLVTRQSEINFALEFKELQGQEIVMEDHVTSAAQEAEKDLETEI